MRSITIWRDELFPEDKVDIELPLTCYLNLEYVLKDLGPPNYIELSFPIKRAIAILWSAKHAHEIN